MTKELKAQELNIVTAYKAGRSFNGAHRDAGTIIHFVPSMPENTSGFWGYKALCGVEPGRRGYGWNGTEKPATCSKCIAKKLTFKPLQP